MDTVPPLTHEQLMAALIVCDDHGTLFIVKNPFTLQCVGRVDPAYRYLFRAAASLYANLSVVQPIMASFVEGADRNGMDKEAGYLQRVTGSLDLTLKYCRNEVE